MFPIIYVDLPMVTIHLSDDKPITVAEGENVTLRCEANGVGSLNYEWRRVSGSLPNNAKRNFRGSILIIQNISVTDSRQYYCKVDNGGSGVLSARVLVIVKSKLSEYALKVSLKFTVSSLQLANDLKTKLYKYTTVYQLPNTQ